MLGAAQAHMLQMYRGLMPLAAQIAAPDIATPDRALQFPAAVGMWLVRAFAFTARLSFNVVAQSCCPCQG